MDLPPTFGSGIFLGLCGRRLPPKILALARFVFGPGGFLEFCNAGIEFGKPALKRCPEPGRNRVDETAQEPRLHPG